MRIPTLLICSVLLFGCSKKTGREKLEESAIQGDARAQTELAFMYSNGDGGPKDDAKAVEWLQKAVAQGDGAAQYDLGDKYFEGLGVPKDYKKAFALCEKAAAQGYFPAYDLLGAMYADGKGVPQDNVRAAAWFILASMNAAENELKTPAEEALGKRITAEEKIQAHDLAVKLLEKIPKGKW